ncbi:MAG: ArsR/SmtB family transcription factor [Candidatus Ranarchaeia archaeon]
MLSPHNNDSNNAGRENEGERKGHIIQTLAHCVGIDDPYMHYKSLRHLRISFQENRTKLDLVNCLEAMGNLYRFMILDALHKKDRCVCELEAILGKSQPTVSHHIKILESAGLIRGWKKGKFTHYSIVKPRIKVVLDLFETWLKETTTWIDELPKRE